MQIQSHLARALEPSLVNTTKTTFTKERFRLEILRCSCKLPECKGLGSDVGAGAILAANKFPSGPSIASCSKSICSSIYGTKQTGIIYPVYLSNRVEVSWEIQLNAERCCWIETWSITLIHVNLGRAKLIDYLLSCWSKYEPQPR